MTYTIVSVDDHASEGPTTFTDRVPASMRDQVPTVHKDETGITHYYVGPKKIRWATHYVEDEEERDARTAAGGLLMTYAHGPRGDWDPVARLKDYDVDGVDAGIMFHNLSSGGNPLAMVEDLDVRLACIKAVNDWMTEEWCATDPNRLFGLAVVPPWDPELAAAEAVRAVEMGHRGVSWAGLMDAYGYAPTWDTSWDPLYAVLQDMDVPLCIHVTGGSNDRVGIRTDRESAPPFVTTSLQIDGVHSLMYPLIEIMMSGMLERFPRLKLYFAEGGASWAPYTLMQCDHYWPRYTSFDNNFLRMAPSDYARRQVYYGFFYDLITPEVLAVLGEDHVMWEADYCHSVSTFPNSRHYQEASLRAVPDETTRRKILAGNAVDLFHLEGR